MKEDLVDLSDLILKDSGLYNDLVGKPYKSKASGPDAYDCFGVIQEVYRRAGINLPDEICTDATESIDSAVKSARSRYIRLKNPVAGCIIAFRTRGKLVTHVGMALDHCRMLHSSDKTDVCIARFDSLGWKSRIEGYYAYCCK